MKNLKQYIAEKLVINKKYNIYKYYPKTPKELRELIFKRYDEQGAGTKTNPVDFNDIDISEMTTLYNESSKQGIFEETGFEYIDISDWDVSSVENMRYMFDGCEPLKSVGDLSKWDISKVKDTSFMFFNCKNLKTVGDLSDWNVSNVENMVWMFKDSGITNIPDWYEE